MAAQGGARLHVSWSLESKKAAGQRLFWLIELGCPWQDSNLRTRLRRPLLYPLSYRGSMCENTTSLTGVVAPGFWVGEEGARGLGWGSGWGAGVQGGLKVGWEVGFWRGAVGRRLRVGGWAVGRGCGPGGCLSWMTTR